MKTRCFSLCWMPCFGLDAVVWLCWMRFGSVGQGRFSFFVLVLFGAWVCFAVYLLSTTGSGGLYLYSYAVFDLCTSQY